MSGFVFSADWHLSYGTWAGKPSLVGDSYYSLRQIIDYCIEHDCSLIAGGGTAGLLYSGTARTSKAFGAWVIRAWWESGMDERPRMADACP